jgi:hypothetical protein
MLRTLALGAFALFCSSCTLFGPTPQIADARPLSTHATQGAPKLILVVVIDGLPMEQLYKHHDLFVPNGFRRLMDRGAVFTDAHQGHAFTLTAPGHAAVSTGAFPYQHGIIGNEWRDRAGKYVYNTQDPAHKYLDGTPTTQDDGVSPKNLRVSTFGDELGYSNNFASRVYTVAVKDRGAILLAGKTGKAFMYSTRSGQFTSTSYYMPQHPQWWTDFYAGKPQDRFFQQRWNTLLDAKAYERSLPDNQPWTSTSRNMTAGMGYLYGIGEEKPGRNYYNTLPIGPFGNEILADFALSMMKGERLGRNAKGAADVIGLSFSSHDYINHGFGPESVQSQDHLIRLDRTLARLFDEIDTYVGAGNTLTVLTADHGFVNAPETNAARGFEAARLDASALRNTVNALAEKQFGTPKLATQHMTGGWTLDYAAMEEKKLNRVDVENFIARTLLEQPGIGYAFTRSQFERGQIPTHHIGKLAQRAWHHSMAIDVMIIPKPYHFFASRPQTGNPTACTHGTPYKYDTHVPMLWHGDTWVKPGRYHAYSEVTDIAPTLATLLRTQFPSGSEGRVLSELWK